MRHSDTAIHPGSSRLRSNCFPHCTRRSFHLTLGNKLLPSPRSRCHNRLSLMGMSGPPHSIQMSQIGRYVNYFRLKKGSNAYYIRKSLNQGSICREGSRLLASMSMLVTALLARSMAFYHIWPIGLPWIYASPHPIYVHVTRAWTGCSVMASRARETSLPLSFARVAMARDEMPANDVFLVTVMPYASYRRYRHPDAERCHGNPPLAARWIHYKCRPRPVAERGQVSSGASKGRACQKSEANLAACAGD